jgi:hypothetical protein
MVKKETEKNKEKKNKAPFVHAPKVNLKPPNPTT